MIYSVQDLKNHQTPHHYGCETSHAQPWLEVLLIKLVI